MRCRPGRRARAGADRASRPRGGQAGESVSPDGVGPSRRRSGGGGDSARRAAEAWERAPPAAAGARPGARIARVRARGGNQRGRGKPRPRARGRCRRSARGRWEGSRALRRAPLATIRPAHDEHESRLLRTRVEIGDDSHRRAPADGDVGWLAQRRTTKPAATASQVSGVTPRSRRRYFCTRSVGVRGSSSTNSM